ncbi:MAG: flagellar motor switch protein FliN, partial [Lachnospiraceae bacterium]|nr:flagellar motor switch protein FliN [Lachnospiraceae bacterium]
MSDGAISQDEIDALLSGVSMDGLNSSGQVSSGPAAHMDVATLQGLADELKPKLESNINSYTNASFTADSPVVELVDRDRVLSRLPEVVIGVMADYNEGVKGEHLYLLAPEFAQKLFSLVNSEEVTEVDDMVLSVVSEVIATHVSAQINSLDATGKLPGLAYATPECVNEPKAMVRFPQGDFALCTYPLTLNGEAFTLWECIAGNVAEKMCNALGGGVEDLASPAMDIGSPVGGMSQPMGGSMGMGGMSQPQMGMGMGMAQPQMGMGMGMAQPQMNMGMGMGMPQMGMGMPQMNMGMNMGMNIPNVQSLQYPNLQGSMSGAEQGNIGLIMDVQMEMTVELGRTKKSIKDILGMGEGTIIELEKLAGEPVDILVNHKQIAKGEVVVIDENFGVRVTEI